MNIDLNKLSEEVYNELLNADKDIDLLIDWDDYPRGFLGGELKMLEIFERYIGLKLVDREELYKEYLEWYDKWEKEENNG